MPQPQDSERDAQLDRIEAKLDALILALAEDEADDRPTHDLEGNAMPALRDDDGTL